MKKRRRKEIIQEMGDDLFYGIKTPIKFTVFKFQNKVEWEGEEENMWHLRSKNRHTTVKLVSPGRKGHFVNLILTSITTIHKAL